MQAQPQQQQSTAQQPLQAQETTTNSSNSACTSRHHIMSPPDTVTTSHAATSAAQLPRERQSLERQPPMMMADRFSSSLASIASFAAKRQQVLQHQQSSSSSDSSANPALVTAASATANTTGEEGTSSQGSSGRGNNSSSGGEDHDGDDKEASAALSSSVGSTAVERPTSSVKTMRNTNKLSARHLHDHNNLKMPPPSSASNTSFAATLPMSMSAKAKASTQAHNTAQAAAMALPHHHSHHLHHKVHHSYHHHLSKSKTAKKDFVKKNNSKESSHNNKMKPMGMTSPYVVDSKTKTSASGARKKRPHPSLSFSSSSQSNDESRSPIAMKAKKTKAKASPSPLSSPAAVSRRSEEENYGSRYSSSGSGTEAGYAGSASSNDNQNQNSKESSSSTGSSSDTMPDFSSGGSACASVSISNGGNNNALAHFGGTRSPSNSPSLSSSSNGEDDDEDEHHQSFEPAAAPVAIKTTGSASLKSSTPPPPRPPTPLEDTKLPAKPRASTTNADSMVAVAKSQFVKVRRTSPLPITTAHTTSRARHHGKKSVVHKSRGRAGLKTDDNNRPPIMSLGSDIMAHVLTFMEPPDILEVLSMPLSKEWQSTFAGQHELWRVLCLMKPFKAQVAEDYFSSSSSSLSSSGGTSDVGDADDDGSLSSCSAVGVDSNTTVVADGLPSRAVWNKKKGYTKTAAVSATARATANSSAVVDTKTTLRATAHHQRRPSPVKNSASKLGKYRLLYTSFVRCMKYLERMKEDVLHGRPPSVIDYGGSSVISKQTMGTNQSLQQFLAGARVVVRSQQQEEAQGQQAAAAASLEQPQEGAPALAAAAGPILSADDGSHSFQSSVERRRKRKKNREQSRRKRPKFASSMLTDRLLAPAASGEINPENVTLPWSCALYSIVNWMVAFADVEGIQIMCLKVLPMLLEDEQQRITAQRVGLTDVILRGMVLFPNSVQLHTASFHTLVLLARPLGGREGMLFHSSMVNAAGIFSGGAATAANRTNGAADDAVVEDGQEGSVFSGGAQSDGKNGIAVMLDSMRRFEDDEALQAMSCWSLVNIALAPVQKEVLVKLGGIQVTTNAMMLHPHSAEVQFRALFALINLVIPSVNVAEENTDLDDVSGGYAEELDDMVEQITNLVVLGMKNFCSSEAILNRACLVLHNLSLTQGYHSTLLWTPNCYQMLEWCLANYRTDQVLQQSAAGTLHRLQVTLSNDENLRTRFAASIQAQQQLSLEAAHREAVQIYEQQGQRRASTSASSRRSSRASN